MSRSTNAHELERWLERNTVELAAPKVTSVLGRGPTLGTRRGATWISFQSKHTLARVVLTASGCCQLTASDTEDGTTRMNSEVEVSSRAGLDAAMAMLVGHLT